MEYFTLFIMGFIAAITPGPDIFYIIRQTICKGFSIAVVAIIGILIGNVIYLTLVGIGVGVVGENLIFQAIVGLFGGIYLLRVSLLIFKDKPNLDRSECQTIDKSKILKEALFLNLSNPKAMIFFTVVVTPFLTKNIALSLASLGVGIFIAFFVAAYIASKFKINNRALGVINKIASLIFLIFAVVLLKSAYNAFIAFI